MSSAAIGDFGQALQHAQVDSSSRAQAEASRNAVRAEAHLALEELEALRAVRYGGAAAGRGRRGAPDRRVPGGP